MNVDPINSFVFAAQDFITAGTNVSRSQVAGKGATLKFLPIGASYQRTIGEKRVAGGGKVIARGFA